MRNYGSIPTTFWGDELGPVVKGNPLAIAMIAYLMSSPHSNMIGIYRLPLEYVKYDTGFSEKAIREAFVILEKSEFAFYDDVAQVVYIPSYAAVQVAPSLSPKDKRISAIQREVDRTHHPEFKKRFLAVYGKLFHLSPIEGASNDSGGPSEGHERGFEGASDPPKKLESVDNQGASKGHRRGLVPDPDLVPVPEGVKRGPGREEENRPLSKIRQFFESWPDYMMTQSRKTH